MSTALSNKERIKEITAGIEKGILELFESDRYRNYLTTMSRFHRYSLNNVMLIHAQRPDATLVAGFSKWKNSFGRHVKKGEKGIQILAPTPYKIKQEEQKLDPDTKLPLLDENGEPITEEKEITIPMFKVVSVFDVSQTDGKPLPQISSALTGDVAEYEIFLEALRRTAPVPISFQEMEPNMDGYFAPKKQAIFLREGMSQVQTICAAVHEVAHSKLHNYEHMTEVADDGETLLVPGEKDRNTEEVEAESISYAVCQYFGIETSENSFGYIATWSHGKELKELRASLETINKTSSELITGIEKNYREICAERGISMEPQEQPEAEAKRFPDTPGDAYAILQLKPDAPAELRFRSLQALPQPPFPGNYDTIYTGQIACTQEQTATLEQLFELFNRNPPGDFTGHSLSVSDIVALKQAGVVSYHYCDIIGFQELPNFRPENYLKTAELSTEDDYGMIDGIINNGEQPMVADLEQQVKSGQPISLMDLADAVHREKKPSVLEKLKEQPQQSQRKAKPPKSKEQEI